MMSHVHIQTDRAARHDPASRAYHLVYREQQVNHCPGCGQTQWLVGRFSAECAFCSTALPLAENGIMTAARPISVGHTQRARRTGVAA